MGMGSEGRMEEGFLLFPRFGKYSHAHYTVSNTNLLSEGLIKLSKGLIIGPLGGKEGAFPLSHQWGEKTLGLHFKRWHFNKLKENRGKSGRSRSQKRTKLKT